MLTGEIALNLTEPLYSAIENATRPGARADKNRAFPHPEGPAAAAPHVCQAGETVASLRDASRIWATSFAGIPRESRKA